jgi:hypothetical protein
MLGGTLTLVNADVSGNGSGIIDTGITARYSNFWSNGVTPGQPDPVGINGNIAVDPLFVDTSNADSSLWDVHLQAGSGLRNAGDPTILNRDGTPSDIGYFGGPGSP